MDSSQSPGRTSGHRQDFPGPESKTLPTSFDREEIQQEKGILIHGPAIF